ncbi:Cdc42 -like protein [Nakaseomyces glabratus]|nr:Cdc42 -like protein [Nakaseomyces glabratus]KTB21483.1 Cdc42 -like protein [Nakaseomyces glabratus]
MKSLKCVLVGDSEVGKTAFLMSYTTGSFSPEYVPTVFDEYLTTIQDKETGYTFHTTFWDTSGDKQHDHLRPLTYPQTDVFLACFPYNDIRSFRNVKDKWIPELKKYIRKSDNSSTVPILLVATKCDLNDDNSSNNILNQSQEVDGMPLPDVKYVGAKERELRSLSSRDVPELYTKTSDVDLVDNNDFVKVSSTPLECVDGDDDIRTIPALAKAQSKSRMSNSSKRTSVKRMYSRPQSEKSLKSKKWQDKRGCICVIL